MSDVIDFLERLGQDSALRHASLDSVLAQARLSPEVRAALASLPGGNVCCMIFAPLEEEQEESSPRQAAA